MNPGPPVLESDAILAALYGLGISRMGRSNLHERNCLDQVSNPGPLALKSHTILAALFGLGISRMDRNNFHERNYPDRVSNRDLWLTILAALYGLGVSGKGKISLNDRKCPDRVSNLGPLAHHIGFAIWPECQWKGKNQSP